MAKISGGKKLEAALAKLSKGVDRPATVKIGFLQKARYADGKPVAMIAAINEFGAPSRGIPPRPFFRNMVADKKDEWPEAVALQLKLHDYDAKAALDVVGFAIAGQLKQSIVDLVDPPNAPSTIARKGFDKPLIDTGHMLNSVDSEVIEGKP